MVDPITVLAISQATWRKIPADDKERIKKAIRDRDISQAKKIAAKYRKKVGNPCPKPIHCSICKKAVKGTAGAAFKTRMDKLRRHRKRMHPKAHKKSVRKVRKEKS